MTLIGTAENSHCPTEFAVGDVAEVAGVPCVPVAVILHTTVGEKAGRAGSAVFTKEAYLGLKIVNVYRACKSTGLNTECDAAAAVGLGGDIDAFPAVAYTGGIPVDRVALHGLCAYCLYTNLAAAKVSDFAGIYIGGEYIPFAGIQPRNGLAQDGTAVGYGSGELCGLVAGMGLVCGKYTRTAAAEGPRACAEAANAVKAGVFEQVNGLYALGAADKGPVVIGIDTIVFGICGGIRAVDQGAVSIGGVAADGAAPKVLNGVAYYVIGVTQHSVRTAVAIGLYTVEGTVSLYAGTGDGTGFFVELADFAGIGIVLVVHGVAGLVVLCRAELVVAVICIADSSVVRVGDSDKIAVAVIGVTGDITDTVCDGSEVSTGIVAESGYCLNGSPCVLPADGNDLIAGVAGICDLVSVSILSIAEHTARKVTQVIFFIPENVVRTADGDCEAEAILVLVRGSAAREEVEGAVAVHVGQIAVGGINDCLLSVQHPTLTQLHPIIFAVGLESGVELVGGTGGVVDVVDAYRVDGAGRAYIVLENGEVSGIISDVTCTGSVNAMSLVAVVAFKTNVVSVLNGKVGSVGSVGSITAVEGGIGTVGVIHKPFHGGSQADAVVGGGIVVPLACLLGKIPHGVGRADGHIGVVYDLCVYLRAVVP